MVLATYCNNKYSGMSTKQLTGCNNLPISNPIGLKNLPALMVSFCILNLYKSDILGHATIAKAMRPLGIGVATGEQCQNRVIFKQLMQANAISFCQIDSCRLGSINENLAVILMAKRFGIPVCPHAGGVGLCEYGMTFFCYSFIS